MINHAWLFHRNDNLIFKALLHVMFIIPVTFMLICGVVISKYHLSGCISMYILVHFIQFFNKLGVNVYFSVSYNNCCLLSVLAVKYTWLYTVSQKKLCQCYFLNNSVKHWPILIICGTQHREETWCKWPQFCPPHLNTVATLPCEMQK